jgi:2-oxoglutarate ferredoxin oxidoreductase subunit delta
MLCQYVCKFEVFEPGQERSALDYLMPRPAKVENCRVCRLCEVHCPDMALTVVAKRKGNDETVAKNQSGRQKKTSASLPLEGGGERVGVKKLRTK